MKILEKRELQSSFEITCSYCTSKLLIEKGDLKLLTSPRPNDNCYVFNCLVCNTQNSLHPDHIPRGMR